MLFWITWLKFYFTLNDIWQTNLFTANNISPHTEHTPRTESRVPYITYDCSSLVKTLHDGLYTLLYTTFHPMFITRLISKMQWCMSNKISLKIPTCAHYFLTTYQLLPLLGVRGLKRSYNKDELWSRNTKWLYCRTRPWSGPKIDW